MKSLITREQYFDFIKQDKDTFERPTAETIYYLNIFDKYYSPDQPIKWYTQWHWFAFFLGPLWFAYRKMYLFAFVLLLLSVFMVDGLYLICMILCGLSANRLYLQHIIKGIQNNQPSYKGQNRWIIWIFLIINIADIGFHFWNGNFLS